MIQFFQSLQATIFIVMGLVAGKAIADPIRGLEVNWGQLPALPDQTGFAGAFAGVSNDHLVVLGGANFPDAAPWDNGVKVWSDKIFILPLNPGELETKQDWVESEFQLPKPLAYGVAVTTEDGIIIAGGGNAESHSDEVWRIQIDPVTLQMEWESLPSLPGPVAFNCGALVGNTLYLAGGISAPSDTSAVASFWSLELSTSPELMKWEELPTWPGKPRMLSVAAALNGSFYLVSGVALHEGVTGSAERTYLKDAFAFRPGAEWKPIASAPHPTVAAPSPAFNAGESHFWILGGDSGAALDNPPASPAEHTGFSREVLSYHVITDTWSSPAIIPQDADGFGTASTSLPSSDFPNAAPLDQQGWPAVTVTGVQYKNEYLIPSGEIRPGIRTPAVRRLSLASSPPEFHWLNAVTLALYLGLTLAAGFYWARKNKNTDDYFRGGQKIPWWVAGLSIYATMLSSLTYMGVPAKAFATNWEYLLGYPFIFIASAIVVKWILPFFRTIDATSAYEYLEIRFNKTIRRLGSALFVFFQIGRMAVVLYLSALALNVMTPMSVAQCILLMGGLSLVYSAIGGVEAVAWTDAIQSVVLLLGAFLSVGWILAHVDGGLSEVWSVAQADHKTDWLRWEWGAGSWTSGVFWVIAIGGLAQNLVSYSSDQAVVQRYMTTPDEKLAARSIWTNAFMALPTGALFFFLGSCLYVFYKTHPESLDPTFKTDAVLPLFIARELPVGLSGMVIAGVFAAAQSTISTSMNSIATAVVTDFIRPFKSAWSDRDLLKSARNVTVIAGMFGIGLGLLFSEGNIQSALDKFFAILGLFGGALGGVFLLGMSSRRANGSGALIGIVCGAVATYYAQNFTNIHVYLHAFIGVSVCMVVGWTTSLLFQGPVAKQS
jgi:solute:Na+ symporter, SSS family